MKFNKSTVITLGEQTYLGLAIDKNQVIEARQICDRVNSTDKDFLAEFEEFKEKRSLDANAYMWALLHKLAMKLTNADVVMTADELYLKYLKEYGQGSVVKLRKGDDIDLSLVLKYFAPHETLADGTGNYFRIWVGSSDYNTEEMSAMIKGVVKECKLYGVETMTPAELARLCNDWGNNEKKH